MKPASRLVGLLLSLALALPSPAFALRPELDRAGLEQEFTPPAAGMEERGEQPKRGVTRREFLRMGSGAALPKNLSEQVAGLPLTKEELSTVAELRQVYDRLLSWGDDSGRASDSYNLSRALDRTVDRGGNPYKALREIAKRTQKAQGILAKLPPDHPLAEYVREGEQSVRNVLARVLAAEPEQREHNYFHWIEGIEVAMDKPNSLELWFTVRAMVQKLWLATKDKTVTSMGELSRAEREGLTADSYGRDFVQRYITTRLQRAALQAQARLAGHGILADPSDTERDYLRRFLNPRAKSEPLDREFTFWEWQKRSELWKPLQRKIKSRMLRHFGRDAATVLLREPYGDDAAFEAREPDLFKYSPQKAAEIYERTIEESVLKWRLWQTTLRRLNRWHGAIRDLPKYLGEERQRIVDQLSLEELRQIDLKAYAQQAEARYLRLSSSGETTLTPEAVTLVLTPQAVSGYLPAPEVSDTAVGRLAQDLARAAQPGAVDLWMVTGPKGSLRLVRWHAPGHDLPRRAPFASRLSREELKELSRELRFGYYPGRRYHIQIPQGLPAVTLERQLEDRAWRGLAAGARGNIEISFTGPIRLPAPIPRSPAAGAEEIPWRRALDDIETAMGQNRVPVKIIHIFDKGVIVQYKIPESSINGFLPMSEVLAPAAPIAIPYWAKWKWLMEMKRAGLSLNVMPLRIGQEPKSGIPRPIYLLHQPVTPELFKAKPIFQEQIKGSSPEGIRRFLSWLKENDDDPNRRLQDWILHDPIVDKLAPDILKAVRTWLAAGVEEKGGRSPGRPRSWNTDRVIQAIRQAVQGRGLEVLAPGSSRSRKGIQSAVQRRTKWGRELYHAYAAVVYSKSVPALPDWPSALRRAGYDPEKVYTPSWKDNTDRVIQAIRQAVQGRGLEVLAPGKVLSAVQRRTKWGRELFHAYAAVVYSKSVPALPDWPSALRRAGYDPEKVYRRAPRTARLPTDGGQAGMEERRGPVLRWAATFLLGVTASSAWQDSSGAGSGAPAAAAQDKQPKLSAEQRAYQEAIQVPDYLKKIQRLGGLGTSEALGDLWRLLEPMDPGAAFKTYEQWLAAQGVGRANYTDEELYRLSGFLGAQGRYEDAAKLLQWHLENNAILKRSPSRREEIEKRLGEVYAALGDYRKVMELKKDLWSLPLNALSQIKTTLDDRSLPYPPLRPYLTSPDMAHLGSNPKAPVYLYVNPQALGELPPEERRKLASNPFYTAVAQNDRKFFQEMIEDVSAGLLYVSGGRFGLELRQVSFGTPETWRRKIEYPIDLITAPEIQERAGKAFILLMGYPTSGGTHYSGRGIVFVRDVRDSPAAERLKLARLVVRGLGAEPLPLHLQRGGHRFRKGEAATNLENPEGKGLYLGISPAFGSKVRWPEVPWIPLKTDRIRDSLPKGPAAGAEEVFAEPHFKHEDAYAASLRSLAKSPFVTQESVRRIEALRKVGPMIEKYSRQLLKNENIKIAIVPLGSSLKGYADRDSDIDHVILILEGAPPHSVTDAEEAKIIDRDIGLLKKEGFRFKGDDRLWLQAVNLSGFLRTQPPASQDDNLEYALAMLFLPIAYGDPGAIERTRKEAITWIRTNRYNWDRVRTYHRELVQVQRWKTAKKPHLRQWLAAQGVTTRFGAFNSEGYRKARLPPITVMSKIYVPAAGAEEKIRVRQRVLFDKTIRGNELHQHGSFSHRGLYDAFWETGLLDQAMDALRDQLWRQNPPPGIKRSGKKRIQAVLHYEIFRHTIDNAIDAVVERWKEDVDSMEVRLQAAIRGSNLWIQVFDNGNGIARKVRARLGKDRVTTKLSKPELMGGDGVGFLHATQHANVHGWRLRASNRRDKKGAVVSLIIPLRSAAGMEEASPLQAQLEGLDLQLKEAQTARDWSRVEQLLSQVPKITESDRTSAIQSLLLGIQRYEVNLLITRNLMHLRGEGLPTGHILGELQRGLPLILPLLDPNSPASPEFKSQLPHLLAEVVSLLGQAGNLSWEQAGEYLHNPSASIPQGTLWSDLLAIALREMYGIFSRDPHSFSSLDDPRLKPSLIKAMAAFSLAVSADPKEWLDHDQEQKVLANLTQPLVRTFAEGVGELDLFRQGKQLGPGLAFARTVGRPSPDLRLEASTPNPNPAAFLNLAAIGAHMLSIVAEAAGLRRTAEAFQRSAVNLAQEALTAAPDYFRDHEFWRRDLFSDIPAAGAEEWRVKLERFLIALLPIVQKVADEKKKASEVLRRHRSDLKATGVSAERLRSILYPRRAAHRERTDDPHYWADVRLRILSNLTGVILQIQERGEVLSLGNILFHHNINLQKYGMTQAATVLLERGMEEEDRDVLARLIRLFHIPVSGQGKPGIAAGMEQAVSLQGAVQRSLDEFVIPENRLGVPGLHPIRDALGVYPDAVIGVMGSFLIDPESALDLDLLVVPEAPAEESVSSIVEGWRRKYGPFGVAVHLLDRVERKEGSLYPVVLSSQGMRKLFHIQLLVKPIQTTETFNPFFPYFAIAGRPLSRRFERKMAELPKDRLLSEMARWVLRMGEDALANPGSRQLWTRSATIAYAAGDLNLAKRLLNEDPAALREAIPLMETPDLSAWLARAQGRGDPSSAPPQTAGAEEIEEIRELGLKILEGWMDLGADEMRVEDQTGPSPKEISLQEAATSLLLNDPAREPAVVLEARLAGLPENFEVKLRKPSRKRRKAVFEVSIGREAPDALVLRRETDPAERSALKEELGRYLDRISRDPEQSVLASPNELSRKEVVELLAEHLPELILFPQGISVVAEGQVITLTTYRRLNPPEEDFKEGVERFLLEESPLGQRGPSGDRNRYGVVIWMANMPVDISNAGVSFRIQPKPGHLLAFVSHYSAAGAEEVEGKLRVLAEVMPGGQALAVQASEISRRAGLEEFLGRLPRNPGIKKVLLGADSLAGLELPARSDVLYVNSDDPADWGVALAGLEAERVVFVGERAPGELLQRILPEMEIAVLSAGAGLEQILLGMGLSTGLLEGINASGLESQLVPERAA